MVGAGLIAQSVGAGGLGAQLAVVQARDQVTLGDRLSFGERQLAHHGGDLVHDLDRLVRVDGADRAEAVADRLGLDVGHLDRRRRHLEAAGRLRATTRERQGRGQEGEGGRPRAHPARIAFERSHRFVPPGAAKVRRRSSVVAWAIRTLTSVSRWRAAARSPSRFTRS